MEKLMKNWGKSWKSGKVECFFFGKTGEHHGKVEHVMGNSCGKIWNMSWKMWKLMRQNDWTNGDGMGRSVMENVSLFFLLDIIGMSCWTERSYSVQAIGDVMSQISTAWLTGVGKCPILGILDIT